MHHQVLSKIETQDRSIIAVPHCFEHLVRSITQQQLIERARDRRSGTDGTSRPDMPERL